MINLYYNYYKPDDVTRLHEINMCLYHNLKNSSINKVILLTVYDYQDIPYKQYHNKIKLINKDSPTFYEMLEIINNNTLDNDINIFCNSDIIIDEKSILLCNTYLKDNDCFALTRYDLKNNINEDTLFSIMINYSKKFEISKWSQDTWILKGTIKNIENKFNYLFGSIGCDNRFAYDIKDSGYNVINPSIDIFTFHYHLIRKEYIRNSVYLENKSLFINSSRLLPFNMTIQIKTKNYINLKKCINSLRLTNYTGDILICIKYIKYKKYKLKILKYCKKNNLIIKKHLNKNNFYCKDNIIFNNLIWYNYYLNKNLSKYKIRQKHI
jgi:hypothetical protein